MIHIILKFILEQRLCGFFQVLFIEIVKQKWCGILFGHTNIIEFSVRPITNSVPSGSSNKSSIKRNCLRGVCIAWLACRATPRNRKDKSCSGINYSFIFCSHFNSPFSLKNFTPINASLFLNIAPSFFDNPINN